jgi:imidazolonepropionase-like amidohydrolase
LGDSFILPGLINAHAHVGSTNGAEYRPEFYTEANLKRQLALYAGFGITAVMSMGDDQRPGFELRDRQMAGNPAVSRLLVAGPVAAPISANDARRQARRIAARRPDFLKIRVDDYFGRRPKVAWEITEAMIEEASRLGVPVAAHVFYLEDAKRLARLGVAVLTRSIRDQEADEEFIRLAKQNDLCIIPALSHEWAEVEYADEAKFLEDPLLQSSRSASMLEAFRSPRWLKRYRESAWKDRYRASFQMASRNLRILAEQGVHLAMGSDSGLPGRFEGYFEIIEMELMQEAGLTASQILHAATAGAASCLRQEQRIGRLSPGLAADFVVLKANPLDGVRQLRQVESVWIAGRRVR